MSGLVIPFRQKYGILVGEMGGEQNADSNGDTADNSRRKSGIIRCAAYCRVSSDSENQLNSFMAQLKYYENFLAGSETETLINVYADEGITGTREEKREEFQRMMNDCRKGKIDRIYTKSISRFARNTKDCLKNIRELKSLGITVFFEKRTSIRPICPMK